MDGEKTNVLRLHLIVLHQPIAERCCGRAEGSLSADLNRHDDEPWQRMNDKLDVIKVSRSGRPQLSVFQLFFRETDGLGKPDRELVMAGAAGVHAASFFLDNAPKFLSDLRISAGKIAHHRDPRHGGAKLVVLNRPGADLIHRGGAVAHRLQERMLDANLRKRLNVLLELANEFL